MFPNHIIHDGVSICVPKVRNLRLLVFLKTKYDENPKKTLVSGAIGGSLAIAGINLVTGNINEFNNSINNLGNVFSRSAMLYSPEMISNGAETLNALTTVADNFNNEILAGVGIVGGAAVIYSKIKEKGLVDTTNAIYHNIVDSFDNINAKKALRLTGLISVIGLAVYTSGCLDSPTGHAVNKLEITATPISTETPLATPTLEPTPEPTEVPVENWWDTNPDYNPAVIPASENLFGVEIEGIKYDHGDGWHTIYDENQNQIFEKSIYTNSNLNLPLEMPDQYGALTDQYGAMKSVTMEQIDSDGIAGMDKVAIKYVGSEGVLEFEMDYRKSADVSGYLNMYAYLNL